MNLFIMNINIYDFKQWWAYAFILVAILIVIATVYFSNSLSSNLAEEERNKAKEWAETNEALETFDEGICLEKSTQPLLKLLSKEELYDLLFSETLMQTEEQQQDIRFELKRRHKLDPNFVGTTDRPEYDIKTGPCRFQEIRCDCSGNPWQFVRDWAGCGGVQ